MLTGLDMYSTVVLYPVRYCTVPRSYWSEAPFHDTLVAGCVPFVLIRQLVPVVWWQMVQSGLELKLWGLHELQRMLGAFG